MVSYTPPDWPRPPSPRPSIMRGSEATETLKPLKEYNTFGGFSFVQGGDH
jgi:hypothetical protein